MQIKAVSKFPIDCHIDNSNKFLQFTQLGK